MSLQAQLYQYWLDFLGGGSPQSRLSLSSIPGHYSILSYQMEAHADESQLHTKTCRILKDSIITVYIFAITIYTLISHPNFVEQTRYQIVFVSVLLSLVSNIVVSLYKSPVIRTTSDAIFMLKMYPNPQWTFDIVFQLLVDHILDHSVRVYSTDMLTLHSHTRTRPPGILPLSHTHNN